MGNNESIFEEVQDRNPEIDLTMGGAEGSWDLFENADMFDDPERAEKFEQLARKSKWVGNAAEFAYLIKQSASTDKPNLYYMHHKRKPVILGLSNIDPNIPNAVRFMSGGRDYINAYKDYHVPLVYTRDRDEKFMKSVTGDPETDIVFVVPSKLYSFSSPSELGIQEATRNEMDYLLNNPDRASNVYLVFGAHEFIDKEWVEANSPRTTREVSEKMTDWINTILNS